MTKPLDPISPGEILLEEFLIPNGVSRSRLARELGVSAARITDIIHGRRGIGADMALRLAAFFGTTAEFWMNLQAEFDLRLARRDIAAEVGRQVRPLNAA